MHLHNILFLSLLLLCMTTMTSDYEIADIKYTTPKCVINGIAMNNTLGHMTIKNDLLGNNLIITYNLSNSFYSCYLCSKYSEYCGNPISSEYIYLTTNILYNLQLLTLGSNNNNTPQKVHSFNVESELGYKAFNSNITIPLNILFPSNKSHCLETYSFLLVGLITIDIVNNKEIVTIIQPSSSTNTSGTDSFQCIPSLQYTQIGIDCNMLPIIHPIRYTVDKCIDTSSSTSNNNPNPPPSSILTYYPPLYWYSEMVFDETMSVSSKLLCGERYDSRLFKSGLYQAVCYNSARHQENIAKYWWMTLFIQLLGLESTIGGEQLDKSEFVREVIYEARDLLERQCDPFHTTMRRGGSPSVLGKITSLYNARATVNQTELCLDLYHYFEKNYNETRGDDSFIHLFNLWYIELFKFVIYPNKIVETKVVLSVGLTFFILLFLVMAIGIIQFRLRVKVKKTNQYVSLDDPYDDQSNYLSPVNQ